MGVLDVILRVEVCGVMGSCQSRLASFTRAGWAATDVAQAGGKPVVEQVIRLG
jgi:hypothetical protein